MTEEISILTDSSIIWSKGEKLPDRLRVILMSQGRNKHYVFPFEPKFNSYEIKIENFTYKLNAEELLLYRPPIFSKLWWKIKLRKIKHIYIVFFKEKEQQAMTLTSSTPTTVDSRTLALALFTRQYNKGLKKLWEKGFQFGGFGIGSKKIIFVIIAVIVVGGLLYYVLSGGGINFG